MNEIETKFFNELIGTLKLEKYAIKNAIFDIRDECSDGDYSFSMSAESVEDSRYVTLTIEAQPKAEIFNGFIPDFAIYINGMNSGYVVEIDGYEWHEKTKEQAMNDKRKDRAFIRNGFIPIRFAGYEVFHNVESCIREVIETVLCNSQMFDFDYLRFMLTDSTKAFERYWNMVHEYETENPILFRRNHTFELMSNPLELR